MCGYVCVCLFVCTSMWYCNHALCSCMVLSTMHICKKKVFQGGGRPWPGFEPQKILSRSTFLLLSDSLKRHYAASQARWLIGHKYADICKWADAIFMRMCLNHESDHCVFNCEAANGNWMKSSKEFFFFAWNHVNWHPDELQLGIISERVSAFACKCNLSSHQEKSLTPRKISGLMIETSLQCKISDNCTAH